MASSRAGRSALRSQGGPDVAARWLNVHVRFSESLWELVRSASRERGVAAAAVVRAAVADSLAAPEPAPSATDQRLTAPELELHLLIAVEQVIALIESILPEGEGAAGRVLAQAALAAQRRIAGEVDEQA